MSYNENMKKRYMERKQEQEKTLVASLYSQMVLDEAWFKLKKERLQKAIDRALDDGDRRSFMKLSGEYKDLMKMW